MVFPLSPALSLCDSLDSLDSIELDAFLDAQPALSRLPTPHVGKSALAEVEEVDNISETEDSEDNAVDCALTHSPLTAPG